MEDRWTYGKMDGLDFVKVRGPLGGCQNVPIFINVGKIFEPILHNFGVDFVSIHMFLICFHGKVWFYKVILCCIIFE